MKNLFSSIIFIMISQHVFAGGFVGNGGNSVACKFSDSTMSYELLDFFEAKVLDSNFKLDIGPSDLSFHQKIKILLDRIKEKSSTRALRYQETINQILNGATFVDKDLVPIDDSFHAIMPKECHVVQTAIRLNKNSDAYQNKWLVNKKIFDLLDEDSKAGLLLHEAIYDELIEYGATQSTEARLFNSIISSASFNKKSTKSFVELLIQVGFKDFSYKGFEISFYDFNGNQSIPQFRNENLIKSAFVKYGSKVQINSNLILRPIGVIEFEEQETKFSTRDSIIIQNQPLSFNYLLINSKNYLTKGCLSSERANLIDVKNNKINLVRNDLVEFDQDLNVVNFIRGGCNGHNQY